MLELAPPHVAIVKGVLRRRAPGARVWVLGKRTKSAAARFTDLDLAVQADAPLDLRTLALIDRDFLESDLPMKVDVIDVRSLSPAFNVVLERDGVELK